MDVLIIAEHDDTEIKPATYNTITAGVEIGEVTVLVAGCNCQSVAEKISSLSNVKKVLLADDIALKYGAAENLAPIVVKIAEQFTHLLVPATTFGKNLMPRISALLDVAQISEITAVIAGNTFIRPIALTG